MVQPWILDVHRWSDALSIQKLVCGHAGHVKDKPGTHSRKHNFELRLLALNLLSVSSPHRAPANAFGESRGGRGVRPQSLEASDPGPCSKGPKQGTVASSGQGAHLFRISFWRTALFGITSAWCGCLGRTAACADMQMSMLRHYVPSYLKQFLGSISTESCARGLRQSKQVCQRCRKAASSSCLFLPAHLQCGTAAHIDAGPSTLPKTAPASC